MLCTDIGLQRVLQRVSVVRVPIGELCKLCTDLNFKKLGFFTLNYSQYLDFFASEEHT